MIAGINKLSYVDYPGELATVIFTAGCNFNCPWCHNKTIVKGGEEVLVYDLINLLKERIKVIDHNVITGGEQTNHSKKLIELLKQIKELGFKIKLDTNGTKPEVLKEAIRLNLIDYIAMDIKNTWDKYELTVNSKVNLEDIQESIKIIENSGLEYQFRTTCNNEMHTESDINLIKNIFVDVSHYKLQNYRYSKEQLNDHDYGSVSYIKEGL